MGVPVGRALIDSGVKLAGWLSVMKTLHAEGRDDATGKRRDQRIFPVLDVGHRVAKSGERVHFFRGGMERFDLWR